MTAKLIRLRFLQLYRGSGDLGLFRVLLMLAVILPLITLFVVQRISISPWSHLFPAIAVVIVWMIHIHRKDNRFLQTTGTAPRRQYLVEYLLFSLPLTVVLISKALYIQLLVFLFVTAMIAFIPLPKVTVTSHTTRLKAIPLGMFEWQSGIRKSRIALALFYLPGLFGFYQVWLAAASLFLITMIVVSFYSEYEPRNMLLAGQNGAGSFLAGKIARHAGFFAVCMLPLLLLALIHNEYRLVTIGYFLASVNLVVFAILLKYYQYRPSAFSGAHQLLTSLACFVTIILPAAGIILFINLFLCFGAYKNLKPYLHA